jgi:hypothetical protein
MPENSVTVLVDFGYNLAVLAANTQREICISAVYRV